MDLAKVAKYLRFVEEQRADQDLTTPEKMLNVLLEKYRADSARKNRPSADIKKAEVILAMTTDAQKIRSFCAYEKDLLDGNRIKLEGSFAVALFVFLLYFPEHQEHQEHQKAAFPQVWQRMVDAIVKKMENWFGVLDKNFCDLVFVLGELAIYGSGDFKKGVIDLLLRTDEVGDSDVLNGPCSKRNPLVIAARHKVFCKLLSTAAFPEEKKSPVVDSMIKILSDSVAPLGAGASRSLYNLEPECASSTIDTLIQALKFVPGKTADIKSAITQATTCSNTTISAKAKTALESITPGPRYRADSEEDPTQGRDLFQGRQGVELLQAGGLWKFVPQEESPASVLGSSLQVMNGP